MSIRAVNSLSHYTDWTIGHVHSGAARLEWFYNFWLSVLYGAALVWGRKRLYSIKLVSAHLWDRYARYRFLYIRNVGLWHYARADVALLR